MGSTHPNGDCRYQKLLTILWLLPAYIACKMLETLGRDMEQGLRIPFQAPEDDFTPAALYV